MNDHGDHWRHIPELIGESVTLIPLHRDHEAMLSDAVRDGELWKLWFARVPSPDQMRDEIDRRLSLARDGRMMPFTVFDPQGAAVGMTSYQMLDAPNRRVEIGFTWYARRAQKTAVNTEAKLLLLTHAFEVLTCISVGFTTSTFNHDSRRAIERLGAKLDGVLRSHSVIDGGIARDTCYYSIIASEWPAVRRNLLWRLECFRESR